MIKSLKRVIFSVYYSGLCVSMRWNKMWNTLDLKRVKRYYYHAYWIADDRASIGNRYGNRYTLSNIVMGFDMNVQSGANSLNCRICSLYAAQCSITF